MEAGRDVMFDDLIGDGLIDCAVSKLDNSCIRHDTEDSDLDSSAGSGDVVGLEGGTNNGTSMMRGDCAE